MRYENLKLSMVKYGFGFQFDDDPSTETIVNVLDRLDRETKELKKILNYHYKLMLKQGPAQGYLYKNTKKVLGIK